MQTVLGIIGGSGLYNLPLENAHWQTIESPWGLPSDQVRVGELGKQKIVFLPRHGRGHIYTPSTINYLANIDVLKRAGVTDVISLSAVGSLREELPPGMFVLVDQFIDLTYARPKSFFGTGFVAHVAFSQPVSPYLLELVQQAARQVEVPHAVGGTYITMEGPQFSTLAESQLYRSWNASVIGMTNMPEAKLVREAEMTYCTIAMVTDYDSWASGHGEVDVVKVLETMKSNAEQAANLIMALAEIMPNNVQPCPSGARHALDKAVMTAPAQQDKAYKEKLNPLLARWQQANS